MFLVAENLGKSFGTPPQEVLRGIDLEISRGEFLALTGRSGSGKSTLLYLLSALDSPTVGLVKFEGRDFNDMSSGELHEIRNRRIGFVFQFHYLLPELSVLENVLLPARKAGLRDEKEKFAFSLLEQFELREYAERLPGEISGGEQQRTAVARALIMDCDILFADEPTGNLDSENGRNVLEIFSRINREKGATIVMVTHEPDYALLADRRIYLADGILTGED